MNALVWLSFSGVFLSSAMRFLSDKKCAVFTPTHFCRFRFPENAFFDSKVATFPCVSGRSPKSSSDSGKLGLKKFALNCSQNR